MHDPLVFYILEAARGEQHFAFDGEESLRRVLLDEQSSKLHSLAALYYLSCIDDNAFNDLQLGIDPSVIHQDLPLKQQYMISVAGRLKYLTGEKYYELEKKLVEEECYRICLSHINSKKTFNLDSHNIKNHKFVENLRNLRKTVNSPSRELPPLQVLHFSQDTFSSTQNDEVTLYVASEENPNEQDPVESIEVERASGSTTPTSPAASDIQFSNDVSVISVHEEKNRGTIVWGPRILECYRYVDQHHKEEQQRLENAAANILRTIYNYTRFVPQRLSFEHLWLIVKVVSKEDSFSRKVSESMSSINTSLLYGCASKALIAAHSSIDSSNALLMDIRRLVSKIERTQHQTSSEDLRVSYWDELMKKAEPHQRLNSQEEQFVLENVNFLQNPYKYEHLVMAAIERMRDVLSAQPWVYPTVSSFFISTHNPAYPADFSAFANHVKPKQGQRPYAFAFYCLYMLQKKSRKETIYLYEIAFIIQHFKCLTDVTESPELSLLPLSTASGSPESIMSVIGEELQRRLNGCKTVDELMALKKLFPDRTVYDEGKDLQQKIENKLAEKKTAPTKK